MKIEFSPEQINLIATALGQRPYVEVAALLNYIAAQVQAANAPPPPENKGGSA